MTKNVHRHIRTCDKNLLEQVKAIAASPAGESPEAKEQIALLAKTVGELADQCSDLLHLLKWLTDNATFPSKHR
jgi:hypothetical protein